MRQIAALLVPIAVFVSSCGGGGGDSSDASSDTVGVATTSEPAAKTTVSSPPTTAKPQITDVERKLVAECVTAVWGDIGSDEEETTRVEDICNRNATALDEGFRKGAGEPLRVILILSGVQLPVKLLEHTTALRDRYYPDNTATFTDNTRRAIARCMDALRDTGGLRVHISLDGDLTGLDEAIETCDVASEAARIDAALDGPGIGITGLVSLDLLGIMVTLRRTAWDAAIGTEIGFEDFDIELLNRIHRLNGLLPLL